VIYQGLTEKPVRDPQDIMRLMEEGSAQRATGSTGANEWSSRSHAVMQVTAHVHLRELLSPNSDFRIVCSSS
jgi:kinesin family protein 2/24